MPDVLSRGLLSAQLLCISRAELAAPSPDRFIRNDDSGLIGRGGLLRVECRAETVPPILTETILKDRETMRFRLSGATDILICGGKSITSDNKHSADAALVRRSANVRKSVFDGPLIWLLPSRLGNERISGVHRQVFG